MFGQAIIMSFAYYYVSGQIHYCVTYVSYEYNILQLPIGKRHRFSRWLFSILYYIRMHRVFKSISNNKMNSVQNMRLIIYTHKKHGGISKLSKVIENN